MNISIKVQHLLWRRPVCSLKNTCQKKKKEEEKHLQMRTNIINHYDQSFS